MTAFHRESPYDLANPDLVHSTTDEDEDDEYFAEQPLELSNEQVVDRQAIAYLLRYETMVRQQEAEDMATMAHVKPLLMRLEALSSAPLERSMTVPDMQRGVTYIQLQQALDQMMEHQQKSTEFMTTDRQFMMVLKTLTNKPSMDHDEVLTYAEIVQCYKGVVAGMQTLQHLQGCAARSRARDRTLSVLSLFESPSTKLLDEGEGRIPLEKSRALETNVQAGGGIMSRLTATTSPPVLPSKTPKGNCGTVVVVMLAVFGLACVGINPWRLGLVEEWKGMALEQRTRMRVDLEVEPSITSETTTMAINMPVANLSPDDDSRKLNKDEGTMGYTLQAPTLKAQSTFQYISKASTLSTHKNKQQTQEHIVVDPKIRLQTLLEDNPHLEQSIQHRRRISAAVGGAAGMVVAPLLPRFGSWVAKVFVTAIQGGGMGSISVVVIASSLVLQAALHGIRILHREKNQE